ncbi:MAG TPA: efflux RND transporter periplasmic adaptor subunit [Fimbriimonadaceae bacterium]|nr:efflux RND transporter periplasmic adaptor subunit [Fimbriimonadaceae bacterium]
MLAVGAFFLYRWKSSEAAGKTQYRVATVTRGMLRKTVSATGTLQPWTTVDIKSKAGGRIDLLAVDVGDQVKAGQIIAKIDPTDSQLTYSQSKADTDAARAKESQSGATFDLQVKQSRSSIAEARAQLKSGIANRDAAAARLQTARDQDSAQPRQTALAIAESKANYDAAVQQREQLTATQAQDRATAKAAYDQAVANDQSAQAAFERQKALYAQGFASKQAVEQAQAAAGVTAASVASAKTKLDTIAAEQKAVLDNTDAKVRQALAELNTAKAQVDVQTRRNALAEAEAAYKQAAAQVGQLEAALQAAIADQANDRIKALDIASAHASTARATAALVNAKTTLDQTVVRAPSEGVVLTKYVEQGTIITSGLSLNSTGTSIVQLGDISRMYVSVLVDETDIASVTVGQKVNISMDAYPQIAFKGKVSRVNPEAQVSQNVTSVAVRVEIDNSEPGFKNLKPNMNATCEFVVEEKEGALSVPSDAIQSDAAGSYVQVVVSPPAIAPAGGQSKRARGSAGEQTLTDVKSERRAVVAGFEGDDRTEIVSGLQEGERIVVQTIAATTTNSNSQARGAIGGGMGGPPRGR